MASGTNVGPRPAAARVLNVCCSLLPAIWLRGGLLVRGWGLGGRDDLRTSRRLVPALAGLLLRLARDDRHGRVCGLLFELRKDAGVRIGGEPVRGVPEHDLDGLHVDAGGEGQRGGAVPQIVQADGR